jgi:hypothetical protein
MIAAIYARRSIRGWRRGRGEALGRLPGDEDTWCPSVQDLALEILRAEDPFDAGRFVGGWDRERRLGHGAILHDGSLSQGRGAAERP